MVEFGIEKEKPMKIIAATLFSLLFLSLGGCNTIAGFGQDVESAGEEIEDTAE